MTAAAKTHSRIPQAATTRSFDRLKSTADRSAENAAAFEKCCIIITRKGKI